jgi:4-amino-4-deoxy-L-arabinose transferase-like glycosyltransferase
MEALLTSTTTWNKTPVRYNPIVRHLPLLVITLLAAALRFYKLGEWSFWVDETLMLKAAQNPEANSLIWPRISLALTQIAVRLLGVSEWSARLAPALIGTLTIPAIYFPIKRTLNAKVALVSALLLATSPWHIYWSQNARFYTSLLLLCFLALLAFFWAIERDRPWHILLFYLLLFLAMVERMIALLVLPAVPVYLLLVWLLPFEKPPGLRVRNLLFLALPALAVGILQTYRYFAGEWFLFARMLAPFLNRGTCPLVVLTQIVYRLDVTLVCLGISGAVLLLARRHKSGLYYVLAAGVPTLQLLALSPYAFVTNRYAFITLPFWTILAAFAITELFAACPRKLRIVSWGVLALVIAGALSQNALYYSTRKGERPDWRSAMALVAEKRTDRDLVFVSHTNVGQYYLGPDVRSIGDMVPATLEAGGHKAWIVIVESTQLYSPALRGWIRDNTTLIDIVPVHAPGRNLSIQIFLYHPPGRA